MTTKPEVPHYIPPPTTKEDLDYADLAIIDLSKASTPEGRAQLANEVRDAMRDNGFFYVINHGYTQEQTTRIFDIADLPFSHVSDEEKRKYEGTMLQSGSYQGYKLRRYWHIDNGVQDQIEHYNINKIVTNREHPEILRPLLPEIDQFAKHNWFNVLHTLLRLLAVGLELPEETFVKLHNYEAVGESWARFMKYYPRTEEEETKTNNVWLKGHTDFGSITILWSQPVSALQVMSPDGKWRWVRHMDNALVVNSGDSMEFLSGGYYRPTIHRVVQPPQDQRGYPRLGAFFFAVPDEDVKLVPSAESPVLQRHGIQRRFNDEDAPTAGQYGSGRIRSYGKSKPKKTESGHEQEMIGTVLVTHYN